MNEQEWETCEIIGVLFSAIAPLKDAQRKLDLVSVAFCRRVWHILADPRSREVVELLEQYARMSIRDDVYEEMRSSANAACRDAVPENMSDPLQAAAFAAALAVYQATLGRTINVSGDVQHAIACSQWTPETRGDFVALTRGTMRDTPELRWQMACIRCVFGNPFRPVSFNPAWRTDTAVALAQQMYESREFGAMPILADALQDAGCEDEAILMHCRDPHQPHVRGCWVCDAVLTLG